MTRDLEERRVVAAIRAEAGAVQAPQRLRETLAAQRTRRSARGRRASLLGASALATAVLATLLLLVDTGTDPGRPSIADAATVALLEPTQPAPASDARAPLLHVSVGAVRFPDYAKGGLAWRPDGLRRERSGGRRVVVVSYRHPSGAHVGYAIVDGPPLPVAAGVRTVTRDGTRFAVLQHPAGTTIVTWRRGGHTCVLASRDATAQAMLEMASWHPGAASSEHY
jgi:hypothetical protein